MIPRALWKKYIFKWDKEQRESCKKYYEQKKMWEKQLKRVAKNFKPWDDIHFLDMINVMLHAYKAYYTQDFNVFQNTETEEYKKKVASLADCCQLMDELMHFDAAHKLLEFEDELHRDGTLAAELQKKVRAQERQLAKEKKKLKLDLFMTIANNYENWWD